MAIVLRHIHTCPSCEQTWDCVCWACASEGEELHCSLCAHGARGQERSMDAAPADNRAFLPMHVLNRLFSSLITVMMNLR